MPVVRKDVVLLQGIGSMAAKEKTKSSISNEQVILLDEGAFLLNQSPVGQDLLKVLTGCEERSREPNFSQHLGDVAEPVAEEFVKSAYRAPSK